MDALGIIIFIIFMIFRAMSRAQKNRRDKGDFPQQTTKQQRPWWEEWDDSEEEEYFPPVKQTKPEPMKTVEEPVKKKQIIEAKAPAEKKTKDQPKDTKKQKIGGEQSETLIPSLDVDQVRQGFIWAEILQPPKAKRNKYRI